MKVRLGLGALSNKHYDNALFPLRTPHNEYLPRYEGHFDFLELDIMRGRGKLPDDVVEWVQQSSKNFRFLPKLWKEATDPHHLEEPQPWGDEALDAARQSVEAFEPIRSRERLGPTIAQFPSRFEYTPEHLTWLDDLLDLEPAGTFAVEFRHPSWDDPEVEDFLRQRGTPLVWSTHPKALKSRWCIGDVGVVRLAGNAYPSAKTRGRAVPIQDRLEDLLELRSEIKAAPWRECFVSVLNPFEGNAIDSLPRVAGALIGEDAGRRLSRKPGDPLLKDPPGAPKQSGLTAFASF